MNIRTLKANEIECRVGTVSNGKGFSLLLYKDARCDMKILDEVFGWDGWKREHELIDGNLHCTVSVWSDKRNEWVSKQDVGKESRTEKEKGQASDAFKRACFNFGIGRELYSAPFIWIKESDGYKSSDKFFVKEIDYNDNKEISYIVITDKKGNVAYKFGCFVNDLLKKVYDIAKTKGYSEEKVDGHIKSKGFSKEKFTKEAFEVMFKGYSEMK